MKSEYYQLFFHLRIILLTYLPIEWQGKPNYAGLEEKSSQLGTGFANSVFPSLGPFAVS